MRICDYCKKRGKMNDVHLSWTVYLDNDDEDDKPEHKSLGLEIHLDCLEEIFALIEKNNEERLT